MKTKVDAFAKTFHLKRYRQSTGFKACLTGSPSNPCRVTKPSELAAFGVFGLERQKRIKGGEDGFDFRDEGLHRSQ